MFLLVFELVSSKNNPFYIKTFDIYSIYADNERV